MWTVQVYSIQHLQHQTHQQPTNSINRKIILMPFHLKQKKNIERSNSPVGSIKSGFFTVY